MDIRILQVGKKTDNFLLEYSFADIRYSRLVKFKRGLRSIQQQTYLQ